MEVEPLAPAEPPPWHYVKDNPTQIAELWAKIIFLIH